MENNIASYPESESTIKIENVKPSGSRFQAIENLNNPNKNGYVSFQINEIQMNLLLEQFQFQKVLNNLRNDFCIVAIRNLLKKNEFLELSLQLSEKLITETEFEKEIESNPEKYIITLNRLENPFQLHIISSILTKIGGTFKIDEVSELFSLDTRSINKDLKGIGLK
jgi:hypothetical protein